MKKRPTLVGLFSFGGPCPREGRGISFPYLAHAGAGGSCHSPCGLTGSPGSGTPARRRRTPAPQPPAMRAKGPSLLGPLRAAYRLRPPAGARAAAAARSRGPGSAGGAAPPARGPGPLRPPAGRGRRRGRPHSPHIVGAGPRRSTNAATGAGEEQCKAGPAARPAGAWPCIAEGYPRATAGGQLDRDAPQARPWPPHDPDRRRRAGRAATSRPGRAGERPAGRWGREGRPRGPDGSPHHRPQAVAPFPVARSSCQRWGPGVGSDAAADSGGGR